MSRNSDHTQLPASAVSNLWWPRDITLEFRDEYEVGGVAGWDPDLQTFAAIINDNQRIIRLGESPGSIRVGASRGENPTIAALHQGLSMQDYTLASDEFELVDELGALVSDEVGQAWLVGTKIHGEAVLAVVHPDMSIRRLKATDPNVGFGWGSDGPGSSETARVALLEAIGVNTGAGSATGRQPATLAQTISQNLLPVLPDVFAVALNELTEHRWEPYTIDTASPATRALGSDITSRGINAVGHCATKPSLSVALSRLGVSGGGHGPDVARHPSGSNTVVSDHGGQSAASNNPQPSLGDRTPVSDDYGLAWPVNVRCRTPEDREMQGVAVWREDRKSFAMLITPGSPDDPYPPSPYWVGNRHGQYPTIQSLWKATLDRHYLPDEAGLDGLRNLGEIVKQQVGSARLVGNKTHGGPVLAMVHPDMSITRLQPPDMSTQDGEDGPGFEWGTPQSASLMTTITAIRTAKGHGSPWDISGHSFAKELAGSLFDSLPDEFALSLDELVGHKLEGFTIHTGSPATRALHSDIAVWGLDPIREGPRRQRSGLTR